MKFFTKILAFYMLALSIIPCGDGGNGIIEMTNHFFEIEYQQHSNHEQHSNNCDDDACSPFCVCSCCSISINVPTNIDFYDKHIMLISQKLPSYKSNFYPSGFDTSIWQPPRFS